MYGRFMNNTLGYVHFFITFVGAYVCLLYTSDAADERSSVDLGGRRIIKKKNRKDIHGHM